MRVNSTNMDSGALVAARGVVGNGEVSSRRHGGGDAYGWVGDAQVASACVERRFGIVRLCSDPFGGFSRAHSSEADFDEVDQALFLQVGDQKWLHRFKVDFGMLSWSHIDNGEDLTGALLEVLTDCVYIGANLAGSDVEWRSWDHVVALLGPSAKGHSKQAVERSSVEKPNGGAFAEHPWLTDIFGDAPHRPGQSTSRLANDRSAPPPEDVCEEDVDADGVLEALAAAREEFEYVEEVVNREHFACRVRGGLWTAAHRGLAYDSIRGQAVTDTGKAFLKGCGLPQSATFSINAYGEHGASVLARYWVARCHFLLGLSERSSCAPGERYDEVALASFAEPDEFRALAEDAGGALAKRVAELRGMQPR